MMKATDYLKKLSEFALKAQVEERSATRIVPLSLDEGTQKAVDLILDTKTNATKVMIIGNGGSAAIASHMQNDLCDSSNVQAIVFNEVPFLTAVSNDHGYETFFEKAVQLWTKEGDVLIAISSSGQSKNILKAVSFCQEKGVKIITFSGFKNNNPLRQLGHLNFYIASSEYGMVESAHALLGHYITDSVMSAQQTIEAK